jgi:hypothetical protein
MPVLSLPLLRRAAGAALASAVLMLLAAGCAGVDPQVYAREQPALDLPRYFDGPIVGHGLFTDRGGQVKRRFVVRITPTWNGDTGTLDEDFTWSDGERQRRIWTLEKQADGTWQGRAPDVVGSARGVVAGNALNWRYTLKLPVDGTTYEVAFDDWMFLVDDRVMMNRAALSFWGFRVGEVLIAFRRGST